LPWVAATRVRSDDGREMIADMLVGFKSLREKFTSKVDKVRPDEIRVHYLDGPMRDLDNVWQFRALDDGSCEVDFSVRFSFRNPLFEKLAGQYVDKAFRKMVAAFELRAAALYGNSSSSATSVA
jgi:coenzyme Q-binding protein COQ10